MRAYLDREAAAPGYRADYVLIDEVHDNRIENPIRDDQLRTYLDQMNTPYVAGGLVSNSYARSGWSNIITSNSGSWTHAALHTETSGGGSFAGTVNWAQFNESLIDVRTSFEKIGAVMKAKCDCGDPMDKHWDHSEEGCEFIPHQVQLGHAPQR